MNIHTENQGRIIGLLNEIAELKGIAAPKIFGPDTVLDQIGLEFARLCDSCDSNGGTHGEGSIRYRSRSSNQGTG